MRSPQSIMLATRHRFWLDNRGDRRRIASLCRFLMERFHLTVVYFGQLNDADRQMISEEYDRARWFMIPPQGASLPIPPEPALSDFFSGANQARFHELIRAVAPDCLIVEYLRLGYLVEGIQSFLGRPCLTLIDTLDVASRRMGAFHERGEKHWINISEREECRALEGFDVIMAIQRNDAAAFRRMLPGKRTITVGHHVPAVPLELVRKDWVEIGFVGSSDAPNRLGIERFLKNVWPELRERHGERVRLTIAGNICESLKGNAPEGVSCRGMVEDIERIYRFCDVIINPVDFGGGLKIKCVEALAYGRPLVTTPVGAEGMEAGAGEAYFACASDDEMLRILSQLVEDAPLRERVAHEAHDFAEKNFSEEAAYGELARTVEELPARNDSAAGRPSAISLEGVEEVSLLPASGAGRVKGHRTPVIIAVGGHLSGVLSLALELKKAFADHPRYRVLVMQVGPHNVPYAGCDLQISDAADLPRALADLPGAVLIPNYLFSLYLEAARLADKGHDLRVIGVCHADSSEEYYHPLAFFAPLITHFLAVSRECAQRLREIIPARAADITFLPNAIAWPKEIKREYHHAPIRLVYAGRMSQKQKRVLDFPRLADELLKRRVDFRFDLIGEGPSLESLRKAMAAVPHGGRVRILGTKSPDEMGEVWPAYDVFLQVSDFEGTSMSMLEAMAHGTVPVLTATSSGIDVIRPGENGLLLPVGDMDAMAAAIGELAANPERLARLGEESRLSVQDHSMESYAVEFAKLLDAVDVQPARTCPKYTPLWELQCRHEAVLDQRDSIARQYAEAVADRDRYKTSFEIVMNKPLVRAYLRAKQLLHAVIPFRR